MSPLSPLWEVWSKGLIPMKLQWAMQVFWMQCSQTQKSLLLWAYQTVVFIKQNWTLIVLHCQMTNPSLTKQCYKELWLNHSNWLAHTSVTVSTFNLLRVTVSHKQDTCLDKNRIPFRRAVMSTIPDATMPSSFSKPNRKEWPVYFACHWSLFWRNFQGEMIVGEVSHSQSRALWGMGHGAWCRICTVSISAILRITYEGGCRISIVPYYRIWFDLCVSSLCSFIGLPDEQLFPHCHPKFVFGRITVWTSLYINVVFLIRHQYQLLMCDMRIVTNLKFTTTLPNLFSPHKLWFDYLKNLHVLLASRSSKLSK